MNENKNKKSVSGIIENPLLIDHFKKKDCLSYIILYILYNIIYNTLYFFFIHLKFLCCQGVIPLD